MKQADRIRQFTLERYILPARSEGRREVTVRAGDVHRDMQLRQAAPAVCSALGTRKFEKLASVTVVRRTGPANGSNVFFTYSLEAAGEARRKPGRRSAKRLASRSSPISSSQLNLADCIVLIACVKSKREHAAPARDLYTSAWFRFAREIAESAGTPWYVLSARYGLLKPSQIIAPYEQTLRAMTPAQRRAWAKKVLDDLLPITKHCRRVVMLAGAEYRNGLIAPLQDAGLEAIVPMQGLRLGEQLSWLSRHAQSRQRMAATERQPRPKHQLGSRRSDLSDFYGLLDTLASQVGGARLLKDVSAFEDWPTHGVYFFFEPGERRSDSGSDARVVRVGTHALSVNSQSTLAQRLRQHRGNVNGGGNHRGSIFRLLVGQAMQARGDLPECPSWGLKNARKLAAIHLSMPDSALKDAESSAESAATAFLGTLPLLWLNVGNGPSRRSLRGYIERNAIALLSNFERNGLDPPSASWLGRHSDREKITKSGLWNQRHVDEQHDRRFIATLELAIRHAAALKQ